ncbi:MAG: NosD domain-containing protein [Candidatus Thorarchaeota archaeon]
MNMRKPKNMFGTSILVLFILTMSFSFSITPLVLTEAVSGNTIIEQSSERLTSQVSTDTQPIREVELNERGIDFSYNHDPFLKESREWDVEQPERESYQSEPLIIPPGTPHAAIMIDSNDDFDTQGWPGDGSSGTPYVIDDLEISATASVPAISISGTDVFFVISDCVIDGSSQDSTGIVLNSVENALIYNNTCFDGNIGILLNQTDGISVVENQCATMNRAGIYLNRSDDNTIHDNFATACWDGIYLNGSSFNDVNENLCTGNMMGIELNSMANGNDIFNNSLFNNYDVGILLYLECNLNTIDLNYIENSGGWGIFIDESDENTIQENYCYANEGNIGIQDTEFNIVHNNTQFTSSSSFGLLLARSNDTLITNNHLLQIEFAIFISDECSGVDLIENNCTFFDYGLWIVESSDILIQDCYFDSLGWTYCIFADESTHLDIINNYLTQTEMIINLQLCEYVNIIGNEFYNYLAAVLSMSSNSTHAKDNLCEMGEQGILALLCYDFLVHNNTLFDHWMDGAIIAEKCPDAIITDNNCTMCKTPIIVDTSEGAWVGNNWLYLYMQGIDVDVSNHTTIIGNHLQEGSTGINVNASFYVDILDNDVIDNVAGPTGIHLNDCGFCLISMNNCTGNGTPTIEIESSPHCEITHNTIADTIDGIVLDESNYTTITDNHITMGQGYGIGVWDSSHCFVSRNHIANISGWEGWALICDGYDNEMTYNLCDNSTVGIYLDSSLESYFAHNTVNGNNESLWLSTDCTNATVMWNIFGTNNFTGHDNSMTAIIDYNFWSNYTGIDSNADGFGDTPYPIRGSANNNDTHPLVYHPTLPTWVDEPTDQEVEWGDSFSYSLSTTASTELAPIVDWWISDTTHFSISGGLITNAGTWTFTIYTLEVRAINLYGFELSSTFDVTSVDTTDPTVVGPADFSMLLGESDVILTWNISDAAPDTFSIWVDGVSQSSGTWESHMTSIGIHLSDLNLEVGEHTIELRVTDLGGNTVTDTVIVTVTAPADDITTLLLIMGAGGALLVVIVIIYVVKKKGAS